MAILILALSSNVNAKFLKATKLRSHYTEHIIANMYIYKILEDFAYIRQIETLLDLVHHRWFPMHHYSPHVKLLCVETVSSISIRPPTATESDRFISRRTVHHSVIYFPHTWNFWRCLLSSTTRSGFFFRFCRNLHPPHSQPHNGYRLYAFTYELFMNQYTSRPGGVPAILFGIFFGSLWPLDSRVSTRAQKTNHN